MRLVGTCMKNEGPFILEWIAYHLCIGFDHFLVYTNDCEDGTEAILDRLQQLGLCTHLQNPAIGSQRPQAAAMRDIVSQPIFLNSEWFLFSDCDEFLNIHIGNRDLVSLIDMMEDARAISIIWRLFGHADTIEFEDALVIDSFRRAAPDFCPHPPQAWGFKTLFRPENGENLDRLGAHRPFFRNTEAMSGRWLNSGGQPIEDWLISAGWRFNRNNYSYNWAQMNHYAIRSLESFLVKSDRGHVLHTHKSIDADYFRTMDQNAIEDSTIMEMRDALVRELEKLKSDPVLGSLHGAAVDWHKEKARALRSENPSFQEELVK